MAEVKSTITSLNARGWTYLPAGLMWGWRTLTPEAPFTQAASSTTTSTDRIMVVMTDGANTRSQGGSLGAEGHETPNGNGADDLTEDLCANIKDDNILVYSIAYEITNTATRNRLEDCASNPSMYFDASNGAELREALCPKRKAPSN